MRSELCAFFRNLSQPAQTPDLKTTGVSQERTLPADEAMKTARGSDHVDSGSQPEVIRVAENYLRVEICCFEFVKANAFDSAGSSDRHEDGRLDLSAARGQQTRARLTAFRLYLES